MYQVCLVRIKEQVGEKKSTVGTHRNADYLLKNMSTEHNKYVAIKNSNILMISVSRNFLVELEHFCFTKQDLSLPLTRYLYVRWLFFLWTNTFNLSVCFE